MVSDLDNDGQPEILLGRSDGLSVLTHKGTIRWHYRMKKPVHDAIAMGDIDDDGKEEIIVIDLSGYVACLNSEGILRWAASAEERVRRSLAIADIDGDSVVEIIIGGYSAALHIFDPDGNLKEHVPLPAAMNACPTIVDFRGENKICELCATIAEIVALSWMETKYQVDPPILGSEYRANSARTGSSRTGSYFPTESEERVRIS